jgi:LacI family transcriptional regulator
MAPMVDPAVLRELLPVNIPVVLLNSPDGGQPYSSLRIDSYGGAQAIVTHLIEHGHRRIGILNGPAQNFDGEERLRGYHAALSAAGLALDAELEVPGDFTVSSGFGGAEALLALPNRPTAIFAANDGMAIGALSALQAAGVAVPEEMALAGFDDVSSAQYTIPPLTSVRGQVSELGARAVARLAEAVEGKEPPSSLQETIAATLVLRRSCGCGAPIDR